MSKLLIPNTCQVPNVFFDELMAGLSNSSLRVLLVVVRFTYGYGKEKDRISLGQLQKATGMSRPGVVKGIKGLGSLITIQKGSRRESNEYSLNLNIATGELVNHVNQSTKLTSKQSDKKLVNAVNTPNPSSKPNKGAARKKREHADSDPRVKTLLTVFAEKYLARVGSPYPITWGKDGQLFKDLLSSGHDVPAIEAVMDRYFKNSFYSERTGFDVGGFKQAFGRLNSAGARKHHNYEDGSFPEL